MPLVRFRGCVSDNKIRPQVWAARAPRIVTQAVWCVALRCAVVCCDVLCCAVVRYVVLCCGVSCRCVCAGAVEYCVVGRGYDHPATRVAGRPTNQLITITMQQKSRGWVGIPIARFRDGFFDNKTSARCWAARAAHC